MFCALLDEDAPCFSSPFRERSLFALPFGERSLFFLPFRERSLFALPLRGMLPVFPPPSGGGQGGGGLINCVYPQICRRPIPLDKRAHAGVSGQADEYEPIAK
jgi:hypothetical protein